MTDPMDPPRPDPDTPSRATSDPRVGSGSDANSDPTAARTSSDADRREIAGEILGYLNFSSGTPAPAFQRGLNRLYETQAAFPSWFELRDRLLDDLDTLRGTSPAFENCAQAEAVVRVVCERCLPAYRQHHADLLAHLPEEDFQHPFLVARFFEAALAEGSPWDDTDRIVAGVLARVNDFLGYRPLAVLENGRELEPYDHERFRPVPLWIRDVGAAVGPYRRVLERTIAFLDETPRDVLLASYFDPDHLDEFALDVRAHDHTHPVNKRTNYTFGEWDPHVIDNAGYYRRFLVRKVILDALVEWTHASGEPDEERLFDAAAVLCGTILMASSISGSGPDTHDSSVTLTSLLPRVARQRDGFYERLLREATGERAERLHREAEATQQPFGHVRQELNMVLAGYGARQVQFRHLAWLYARLGFPKAARKQAAIIPSTSARFETEIQWRLTSARIQLDRGELDLAVVLVQEARKLVRRGIECGALVDPWNILAFQGQFPLFASREDAVPDQRVETLIDLMDQLFDVYGLAIAEAAARGERTLLEEVTGEFQAMAEEWDRYATHVVEDVPAVKGAESYASARLVADVVGEWRAAGEAAADLSFWSRYADRFPSPRAYARVIDALLRKRDHVASRALLVQWLGRAEEVGLGHGADSLFPRLTRWVDLVVHPVREEDETTSDPSDEKSPTEPTAEWLPEVRKFFDYVEANSEGLWDAPRLEGMTASDDGPESDWEQPVAGAFDEEDELYEAAREGVVFMDSTFDGIDGDILDDGGPPATTEFERTTRRIEPRLRFLQTVARGWETTAMAVASRAEEQPRKDDRIDERAAETLGEWWKRSRVLQHQLTRLLRDVHQFEIPEPSGEMDSNIEYDLQLQTKFYLLHAIVSTHIAVGSAERCLGASLRSGLLGEGVDRDEQRVSEMYAAVLRRDKAEVKRLLPKLVASFHGKPLLYVPFDNGGDPRAVLDVRTRQHVLRFLVTQLPRLGLLRETWHLLRTAYRMERQSRPEGVAVTEFDRLFRTALRSSLEVVAASAATWRGGRFDDTELVDVVADLVDVYGELWGQHSRTMRLSTVESLLDEETWERVRGFVEAFGDELFHARMLTLGNVRAILQNGVEWFLEYLSQNDDPIRPSTLVLAIENERVDIDDVVDDLELVYGTVVEKFERFLEYNTTTTQSDYGAMFHCLLDFLRLEAEYEREAWLLVPVGVAHEVLCQSGRRDAALVWERVFEERTEEKSEGFVARLANLERRHAMRLASVRDHLEERFVKSLVVNRMVALVPRAAEEARRGDPSPEAFARLKLEIDGYLARTAGSGIDVPPWLRSIEKAVDAVDTATREPDGFESLPTLPTQPVPLRELRRQLRSWKDPLFKNRKPRA